MLVNVCPSLIRSFNIQRYFICGEQKRFIQCSAQLNKNGSGKQALILHKLLNSRKKNRKYYICENPPSTGGAPMLGGQTFRNSKENSRRIAVLNKLFLSHISDLLMTGSLSDTVYDKGLEITRVEITRDFQLLNIFWSTNNEKHLDELQAILPTVGFALRHELSQLRVTGIVPRIMFVKDRHLINVLKLDALLKTVDFGEDHEPCELESDFKVNQEPQNKIDSEQENSVKPEETCVIEDQEKDVGVMPVMRQDTFNLDHNQIMNKVMKMMYKTKAIHRSEPNLAIVGEGVNPSEMTIDNMSKEDRKKALSKFILQSKIQKEKANRDKYNSQLNVPVYEINEVDYEDEYEEFGTDFIDDYNELTSKKYNK